jgi:poly(glycerol-phosphate) alpha-glucosyltransferase
MASLKVAFLMGSISHQSGGLFTSVRPLAQALRAEPGLELQVLGLADEATVADLPGWAPVRPVVYPGWHRWLLRYSRGLSRAVDDLDVDLVHTHNIWLYPAIATARWGRRTRKPYMVTARGMLTPASLRISRWKKVLAGPLYANAYLRGAACLHALSTTEAQAFRSLGLVNPICVIPNGVELPQPDDGGRAPWASEGRPGRKHLLYLGRLARVKNLPALLRAWQALQEGAASQAREWRLVLAGYGQRGHDRQLREQVRKTGLEDSVLFCGPLWGADKAAAYRSAHGFVLPSFGEGLPVAVLEAWAYGLPVVMTEESGLPEGFAAGAALKIGLAAPDIARGLEQLMSMSEAERKEMGARGRALAQARFNWPLIARQMIEVYSWLAGGGPKPECVLS